MKDKIYTVFKNTDREFTGTLPKIAEHFNKNYNTLNHKINNNKNMSIEEAINFKDNRFEKYTAFKNTDREFNGTLKQISKHFNVDYNTLIRKYKKLNIPIEEIIDSNYKRNIRNKIYIVFKNTNREFKGTYKEIAKHFNISYGVLLNRVNKLNISIEDAIDFENKVNIYTVFEGTYREFTGNINQISKYFNINYKLLLNRINNLNISIEEAILTPLIKIKQNNLTYKGQKGTMKELCQKFDKNFIEVYNKVKYNHTFEWAMDSTEKPYEE